MAKSQKQPTTYGRKSYRVGEAARMLGLHPDTVRKMTDSGEIHCFRIGPRQERRIPVEEVLRLRGEQNDPAIILYARASGPEARRELEQQLAALRAWATQHYPQEKQLEISDVAEGAEPARAGLSRLLTTVQQRLARYVVVTSADRLAHDMGAHLIRVMCESYGVQLFVLDEAE